MKKNILQLENFSAKLLIENKSKSLNLLKNINLTIKEGEKHIIMGPNGSGKSSLSKCLAGHPSYEINSGHIFFKEKDMTLLSPEERSYEGLFLGFQYPLEIPGVTNEDFLREIYNAHAKYKNIPVLNPIDFFQLIQKKLNHLHMDIDFLKRNVNEGFSGGEKKRNELLQMLLIEPTLIVLDEIDSGLDVDAIFSSATLLNEIVSSKIALLIITHYNKFSEKIGPDFIHIMQNGTIIKTGNMELGKRIEKEGFGWIDTFV